MLASSFNQKRVIIKNAVSLNNNTSYDFEIKYHIFFLFITSENEKYLIFSISVRGFKLIYSKYIYNFRIERYIIIHSNNDVINKRAFLKGIF